MPVGFLFVVILCDTVVSLWDPLGGCVRSVGMGMEEKGAGRA